MFEKILQFPRERIYRIGISFVLFFILINICVYAYLPSFKQTGRASEFFLDINICNFSDKDLSEIENLIKNDTKDKIFLLGDSIMYGIGIEEKQSVSGNLRSVQNKYSVYNLSVCGAKPLDFLLWIQYLNEIEPGNKNIYLVQYNYKWFGLGEDKIENVISQKKTLQYFKDYLSEDLKTDLNFNPNWFNNFTYFVEKNIPVVSSKTTLFALIFRERSKEDLIKHVFFGGNIKPSFEEKKKNFNCRIDYASGVWEADDFNYKIYLKTLDFINKNQLNALVFIPAYNEQITGKCQDEKFQYNLNKFIDDAEVKNVTSAVFVKDIPPELFLDDMHLTEEGSKNFAEKIFSKISQ